jgi:hypothetical protein
MDGLAPMKTRSGVYEISPDTKMMADGSVVMTY